jgi:hypothetical protein
MAHQIEERAREEDCVAENATGRGMAGVVRDLNDQLAAICAYASRGGDVSYDAERTENYFALIESAGNRAAEITGELLVLDTVRALGERHTKSVSWPTVQHAFEAATDSSPSSFRRRLGLRS